VTALAQTPDGAVWVGTGSPGTGVSRLHQGRWRTFISPSSDIPPEDVTTLAAAPDGGLWIGTEDGGLARFQQRLEVFNPENSPLPDDDVRSLAVGRDGVVWVGTLGRGLARFDGDKWEVLSKKEGCLPDDGIMSILPTADGAIWIGTGGGGVVRLYGPDCQVFNVANSGLPGMNVHHLGLASDGSLWAHTIDGGFARFRDGQWQEVAGRERGVVPDEAQGAFVLTAPNGATWGYDGRALVRTRDGREERFTLGDGGLPGGRLEDSTIAPDGSLWIAVEDGTLARFDGSHWQVYTAENAGLPRARPLALAVASDGGVWVGTTGRGLVRFKPPDARPEIVELMGGRDELAPGAHTFTAVTFDPGYRTRPEEFRYVWVTARRGRLASLTGSDRVEIHTRSPVQAFTFDAGERYMLEVTAIDRYGYRSQPSRHDFVVRLPQAGSTSRWPGVVLGLLPLLYLVALVPLVKLYPRSSLARTAVNSGAVTKFPLLHKTILNSRWARGHVFRSFVTERSARHRQELPRHYVAQSVQRADGAASFEVNVLDGGTTLGELLPRLMGREKRAIVLGRSGTGKSVLLRSIAVIAGNEFLAGRDRRLPVLLNLRRSPSTGDRIEELVRDVMRGGGVELPDDVMRFLIEKGGLLLLLDSANEVSGDSLRDALDEFLTRDANNWVIVASQQDLLRRPDVALSYLRSFTPQLARAALAKLRREEDVWDRLPQAAQRLALNPKDLEVLARVLEAVAPEDVPIRRAALYRALLEEDAVVRKWVKTDDPKIRAIYGIAFRMVDEVRRALSEEELGQWTREQLDALGVGKERQADETAAVLGAIRRSRMFAVETEKLPPAGERELLVFQHELMGTFLAARDLRQRLAPEALNELVEFSSHARLLEVFFFMIDEPASPPLLAALSKRLIEAGGELRLRIVAYALDTAPAALGEDIRTLYQQAKIDADLRDTPAR
jgi:streptogramin lyase